MNTRTSDEYFAGLIEGKGGIYSERRGKTGYRAVVEVFVRDEAVANAARDHFDCGVVAFKESDSPKYGSQWQWRVQGLKAVEVAERLEPHLVGGMASRAARVLSWYTNRPKVAA